MCANCWCHMCLLGTPGLFQVQSLPSSGVSFSMGAAKQHECDNGEPDWQHVEDAETSYFVSAMTFAFRVVACLTPSTAAQNRLEKVVDTMFALGQQGVIHLTLFWPLMGALHTTGIEKFAFPSAHVSVQPEFVLWQIVQR